MYGSDISPDPSMSTTWSSRGTRIIYFSCFPVASLGFGRWRQARPFNGTVPVTAAGDPRHVHHSPARDPSKSGVEEPSVSSSSQWKKFERNPTEDKGDSGRNASRLFRVREVRVWLLRFVNFHFVYFFLSYEHWSVLARVDGLDFGGKSKFFRGPWKGRPK